MRSRHRRSGQPTSKALAMDSSRASCRLSIVAGRHRTFGWPSLVVRALDHVALKFRERNERYDAAVVDVRSGDGEIAVGAVLLGDFEEPLGAGWADRNHHDSAGLELSQQRWRDMVDAAGDDDLVEGGSLLPAVITIRCLAVDRL